MKVSEERGADGVMVRTYRTRYFVVEVARPGVIAVRHKFETYADAMKAADMIAGTLGWKHRFDAKGSGMKGSPLVAEHGVDGIVVTITRYVRQSVYRGVSSTQKTVAFDRVDA